MAFTLYGSRGPYSNDLHPPCVRRMEPLRAVFLELNPARRTNFIDPERELAVDVSPILKVMLEDIPRHGPKLAEELRRAGAEIKKQAEQELAELYPKDPDGATPIEARVVSRQGACVRHPARGRDEGDKCEHRPATSVGSGRIRTS